MTYDFILMNPPYNVGGKITKATLNSLTEDGICVCLMPLAQYKKKDLELWRHVETMNLADSKMFEDASITDNLCICCLKKKAVDEYTWEELESESYGKPAKEYFIKNKSLPILVTSTPIGFTHPEILESISIDKDFYIGRRFATAGKVCKGFDWKWNVEKSVTKDDFTISHINRDNVDVLGGGFIRFQSNKAKYNLAKVWYETSLIDFLLGHINSDGAVVEVVVPQINWETISDHPLWKEGKYDEAVLNTMNLKWNEDKTGVEGLYDL